MGLILITPPAVEPVSIAELKEYLRLDLGDTSQDNVLSTLAMAARSWCEVFVARRFVKQTWAAYMDFFPGLIDQRLTSQQFSSPFVSGANAVLVGIRFAVILPYPPVMSVDSFIYQNADGQITSMINGPLAIGGVTNTLNQPISINTVQPHGLPSGATVTIASAPTLLALLGNQASQVITVTDPNDFQLNGTVGTGASIPTVGTVTGFNYVQDIVSNPARLTPIFGQYWPVARVVVNAVQVNFTLGYAIPVTVTMEDDDANKVTPSGYTFQPTDVGRPISIPGAGPNGGTLNTVIASIPGGGSTAETRDASTTPVTGVTALLVNNPNGNPSHWEMFKAGIKLLVAGWYENRIPDENNIPNSVKAVLLPARDLRF